jgi:hypothetical protein
MQVGACPYASEAIWWTRVFVGAVMGDEAAVTELVAAVEELTGRLNQNNHFTRTAVQLTELSSLPQREQLRSALTAAQPCMMLQRRARSRQSSTGAYVYILLMKSVVSTGCACSASRGCSVDAGVRAMCTRPTHSRINPSLLHHLPGSPA